MLARIRPSVSRLVDGLGGPALSNAALLIEGDRIAEVGVEASVPRPEDCLELTFPDATAVPGLIDAHVHLTVSWESTREGTIGRYVGETDGDLVARAAGTAERMLRVGVTSAFSCGERGATAFAIRDAIARGVILGPRLIVSGRPLTPTSGHRFWMGGVLFYSDPSADALDRETAEDEDDAGGVYSAEDLEVIA